LPSVEVTLNLAPVPWRREGGYVMPDGGELPAGSDVRLTFDLPLRTTEELMPSGRAYQFQWWGDEIAGVSPPEGPLPFYPEAH
jgi:hypothetical protein